MFGFDVCIFLSILKLVLFRFLLLFPFRLLRLKFGKFLFDFLLLLCLNLLLIFLNLLFFLCRRNICHKLKTFHNLLKIYISHKMNLNVLFFLRCNLLILIFYCYYQKYFFIGIIIIFIINNIIYIKIIIII